MNVLENTKANIKLYWNPRCACNSIKQWFGVAFADRPHSLSEKRVIVVRNPINRFASILNHPVIFEYIKDDYTKKRIDELLTFLETNGTDVNDHFKIQSDYPASYFTHIIKIEDGNIIKKLNDLVGTQTEDIVVNTIQDKFDNPQNYEFDYSQLEIIYPKDFTEEQTDRIKQLYKEDFNNFYS